MDKRKKKQTDRQTDRKTDPMIDIDRQMDRQTSQWTYRKIDGLCHLKGEMWINYQIVISFDPTYQGLYIGFFESED